VKTYICDRCIKPFTVSSPFETESGSSDLARGVTISLPVLVNKKVGFKEVDLCGACVEVLCDWVKPAK
jgi:hypothetical protein